MKTNERKNFNVLIACEASGIVGSRFNALGYNVFTCDIQSCYNKQYRNLHLTSDVFTVLNTFKNVGVVIDLLVAFPPCTFLSNVGNRWINDKENYPNRELDRELALKFFFDLWNTDKTHGIKHICLENPRGYLSQFFTQDEDYQVVQPYYFGEYASKATCLFTKNLPFLTETDRLKERKDRKFSEYFAKLNKKRERSETFKGLASALVLQYDAYLDDLYDFEISDNFDLSLFDELTTK